ncbi:hypothetical protein [Mesorhizobium sp. WSM3860]|uniref:hypothetical protein n=1 Tax=Mesorhizobium sp. WSM3860 TaxID=2029403 RepID=UPI000BAFA05B|nr:hypothetical protein [Mesorhizobium sp. WSM3860]PBC04256.1 hypothetical protein CK220_11605 [Mesorhizobium sp. WSM3860]
MFEVLVEPAQPVRHFASHFLLAYSLELALKSFLAASGTSKADIFDLGHRPKRILKRCKTKGLPEVNLLCELVVRMEAMNKLHDFRYPAGYRFGAALHGRKSHSCAFPPPSDRPESRNGACEGNASVRESHATPNGKQGRLVRLTAIFAATALMPPSPRSPSGGLP